MSVYQPRYKDKKTGKSKQSEQWWYNFRYNGERIREPAKTTKKTIARMAEDKRRRELEEAGATGKPLGTAKATRRKRTQRVVVALGNYQVDYAKKGDHEAKGVTTVEERIAALEKYFITDLVVDLTEDRVQSYIDKRKVDGVSGRTINMETDVLSRATGMRWTGLRQKERRDVGIALTPDEEQRLIEAASRNVSRMIHTVVRIGLGTGMRRDEIRLLRWSQIDFELRTFTVGKSKTDKGTGRIIPFDALHAVLTTYASWYASKFGVIQPEWYVFPFSNRRDSVDPTRPLGSFKSAWTSIRTKAGVKCRFHDLRHTVCTKMAEAGVPESTMLAIMGHMSKKMLEKYSHIRMQAKRDAIQSIESRAASALSNEMVKVLTQVEVFSGSKPS